MKTQGTEGQEGNPEKNKEGATGKGQGKKSELPGP